MVKSNIWTFKLLTYLTFSNKCSHATHHFDKNPLHNESRQTKQYFLQTSESRQTKQYFLTYSWSFVIRGATTLVLCDPQVLTFKTCHLIMYVTLLFTWKSLIQTEEKSVVFRWLRNKRSGKHFSHTRLGVWVRVCRGSSGQVAFQNSVVFVAFHHCLTFPTHSPSMCFLGCRFSSSALVLVILVC